MQHYEHDISLNDKYSLGNYLRQQRQSLSKGLRILFRTPLSTLLLLILLSVLIALPAGFYLLLNQLQVLSHSYNNGTQISLFLKTTITEEQALTLQKQLQQKPEIEAVRYISPEEGLKDFKNYSGMADILAQLPSNPLPAVLQIQPSQLLDSPSAINQFVTELRKLPEVEIAQLDLEWIKRLYSIITLMRAVAIGLQILFAAVAVALMGHTIAYAIQNERAELRLLSLLGASPGYLRRRFWYAGINYGLASGILACCWIYAIVGWLNNAIQQFTNLYGAKASPMLFNTHLIACIILAGVGLGMISACIACLFRFSMIKPRLV